MKILCLMSPIVFSMTRLCYLFVPMTLAYFQDFAVQICHQPEESGKIVCNNHSDSVITIQILSTCVKMFLTSTPEISIL